MTEPKQSATYGGLAEIVRRHRRQIELSPGVGAEVQRYGIAVCDDILSDLERSAVSEKVERTCPRCGEKRPCGFQGCHMESALSAERRSIEAVIDDYTEAVLRDQLDMTEKFRAELIARTAAVSATVRSSSTTKDRSRGDSREDHA